MFKFFSLLLAGDQLPETTCEVQFLSSNHWSARLITIITCIVAFYAPVTAMSVLYALVYAHTRRRTRDLQSLCASTSSGTANSIRSTGASPTAAGATGAGGKANANVNENGNGKGGGIVPADGVVISNANTNSIPHSSSGLLGGNRLRKKSSSSSAQNSHREVSRTSSSNRYTNSLPLPEEVDMKAEGSSGTTTRVARTRNWFHDLCLTWASCRTAGPHQSMHTESETLGTDAQTDAVADGFPAPGRPARDIPLVLMNTRIGARTAHAPDSSANGDERATFSQKRKSGIPVPLVIPNSHSELYTGKILQDSPRVRNRKLSWLDESGPIGVPAVSGLDLCSGPLVRDNSKRSYLSVLSDESIWVDSEVCRSPASPNRERKSLIPEDTLGEMASSEPMFREAPAAVGGRDVDESNSNCNTPGFVTACGSLDVLHTQHEPEPNPNETLFARPPNTLLSPYPTRTPTHQPNQQKASPRTANCESAAAYPSPLHLLSPPISPGTCSVSSPSTVKSVLSGTSSCKSCSSSSNATAALLPNVTTNPMARLEVQRPPTTSVDQKNAFDTARNVITNARSDRAMAARPLTRATGASLRPPLPKQISTCSALQPPSTAGSPHARRSSLNALLLPPLPLLHSDSMRSRLNSQSASATLSQTIVGVGSGGGGGSGGHGRASTVSATARLEKGERKAMKTLLAILAAFIITW